MRRFSASLVALSVAVALGTWAHAQGITKSDEYRVATMLHDGYDAVRRNYYDPTFHGVDLDARYVAMTPTN